jgi:hypothetical protein
MTSTAVSLVTAPLLALVGVLLGHALGRRSAVELDRWRKREETMRMLRWGTEISLEPDPARGSAGVAILAALLESPLLDPDDRDLVGVVATVAGDVARGRDPTGERYSEGSGGGSDD